MNTQLTILLMLLLELKVFREKCLICIWFCIPIHQRVIIKNIQHYIEKSLCRKSNKLYYQENTMRKLIKDNCKNTSFVFDNEICEQIDAVSMGLPLAPVLVNIIMTEKKAP